MIEVIIGKELKEKCPHLALGIIQCRVDNTEYNKDLWLEIRKMEEQIRNTYKIDQIKNREMILATRMAYKKCGKDPNRYRPSAEALTRRIVRGIELYKITTLVDVINLISLKSGYSIGGFDADLVEGSVRAGIGIKNEAFTGIGRGILNIEGLPVLRDEKGAIGTPTSDEERTSIKMSTRNLFMNINGYTGEQDLNNTIEYSVYLLEKYTNAQNIKIKIVTETD